MQIPQFLAETAGWLAFHFDKLQPYLPTYAHLLVSAVAPIYAGAHASLTRPASAARPAKKKREDGTPEDDDEEEETVQKMEGLSTSDAFLFPVMAGITLSSLYFIIKWLEDPTILNKVLNWYFASFSVFSVCRLVSDGLDVFHSILFPHDYVDGGILFHVDAKKRLAVPFNGDRSGLRTSPLPGPFSRLPLPRVLKNIFWFLYIVPNQKLSFKAVLRSILDVEFKLGIHGLEGITIGMLSVLYFNFVAKPWFLTNLFGFGFSYGALQLLSPTTFSTGSLLLSLLFFYDIYFVFYTPMMVGVAKSLDVPVKLLFPAPPRPDQDPSVPSLSMLGLGDIVLPGIMIGLALRFDLYLFYLYKQSKRAPAKFEKETSEAPETIKAPYKPVSEGWGDRLWTSRMLGHFLSPMSPRLPVNTYTPRGVFPKPYFTAGLAGYVIGMITTLAAMQVSDHPQPALLYLVPGVLGSIWLTALARGELKLMWAYSDAAEVEGTDASKDGKGKKERQTVDQESKKDDAGDAASKAKGKAKKNRSVVDKLGDRLEKQLDAFDAKDKVDGADRTLFAFSVRLPPLQQPLSEGKGDQNGTRWREKPCTPVETKTDEGHSDKRIRVE